MATANPYAAWGKANAPGSYSADYSGNPYADWGEQQSQKIAATKAALSKPAAPKQIAPAKIQKPKKPPRDPNTIGNVAALKSALADGSITHDQFTQRFSVLTNEPTKPSLHTGLNPKTAAETAEQTGISLAQFFPRATTELALSLQPTSNAMAPARPNNSAPQLSITKQALPKPVTKTPTRAVGIQPNNVLTHALFGQAPVTSLEAQGKGAETSHPGGFGIAHTPIRLTPRETGIAEIVGKTASDLLAFKGGIEAPGRAAARVRAKIDNVKQTVRNAAVNDTLEKLPRETQPVAATVPHETAPRKIEEPAAPGAEEPQTQPGHGATFKDNYNQLKTIMVKHDIYLEDIEHDMGRKIDENNPQDVQAALNHVKQQLAGAGRPVEEPKASAPHQENPQEPAKPPAEAPKPPELPKATELYHGTNADAAVKILQEGNIKATPKQLSVEDFKAKKSPSSSVSLSRDKAATAIHGNADVKFVVDRDILKQTNKLEPYGEPGSFPRAIGHSELEERTPTGIPIKAIKAVELGQKVTASQEVQIRELASKHGIEVRKVAQPIEQPKGGTNASAAIPQPKKVPPKTAPNTPRNEQVVNAFNQSKNHISLGTHNGVDFEIGSFGRQHFDRKLAEGKGDRFATGELKDTLSHITRAFKASDHDTGYRKDNIAWLSEMPDGEKRIVYTRKNAAGNEEVISWHKLNPTKEANYLKQLASYGSPGRGRTGNLNLEDKSGESAPQGQLSIPSSEADHKAEGKANWEKMKEYGELQDKQGGLTAEQATEFRKLAEKHHQFMFDSHKPVDISKVKPATETKSTLAPKTVATIREDVMRDRQIYEAVTTATDGVYHGSNTPIDDIMEGSNKEVTPKELYDNFSDTREALREQYGDTVPLYRAVGEQKSKITTNWATTEEFVKQFGDNITKRDVPVEDVVAANVTRNGMYHELVVGKPPLGEVKLPTRNTEAGSIAPGQMADDIKSLLERSRHTTKLSKDVSDNLFKLRQEQKADIDLATKVLKSNDVSEEDWTAVYHYAEDKNSPVTAAQKKLYDEVIRPLQESSAKDEVPTDYVHRINIDKRGFVQGILKGDFSGIRKSLLRRTADSANKRTMKAIVDENGERTVVSIKTPTNRLGKAMGGKRVTGFREGNATDLGLLKRPTLPKVMEFYDPALMDGLDKIAADLGIKHERLVRIPYARKGVAGVSYTGKDLIRTKAASGEEVLLHELGHQIDDRYGLKKIFNTSGRNPEGSAEVAERTQEMRALADLRFENGVSGKTPGYTSYVRSGSEKIANMFAAYLHAPEVFKEIAPNTYKDFVDFVTSHPELKPITELRPTMVLGAREIGEDADEPGVFVSRAGRQYRIEQATTKEIEHHAPVKYSHHALLNTLTDFVQSRSAARAAQFIDEWKQDPSFAEVAKKVDANNIPDHYIASTAPQFRGYVFEPKVAHYLDDFAGAYQKDPLDAITNLNRFLTTTIFVNPFVHIPNEFISAFINRGARRYANPASYDRLVRTGGKAIVGVIKRDKLYDELQRAGMPSMAYGTEEFNHTVGKLMRKQLQNPYWDERLLAAGVRSPKTLAESFMHNAHKFTWVTQDILNMQSVLEREAEGMSRQQAIDSAFTTGKGAIPDYRMPTTVLGSRKLQGIMKNPNINVFGNYHLGILKSYMNIMKNLISKDSTIKDRADALDKVAVMGVLAFVIYPQLDHLARAIFGNADAKVRRSGALTIPEAAWDAVHGRKGLGDVVRDVFTPPPGTTTAVQLTTDKDAFGGQIYDPKELITNPKQAAKDIGSYAATSGISPVGQASRATKTPMKVVASLFGVSEPKSDLENKVNSLLDSQYGSSLTVQDKRIASMKAAARNQIAAGNGDSKARALVAMGVITQDNLPDFKASAKQTSLQRGFDNLSLTNKEKVLETAKPSDYTNLGDMKALQVNASHYLHTSAAKPASVAAAKAIIKRFGGDPDKLYTEYKAQQKTKREATAARKKAAAH